MLEDINTSFEEIDSFFQTIIDNGLNGVTIYVSLNVTAPITDKIIIALLYFNARSIATLNKPAKDHGMINTRLPFDYNKITTQ